jgi:hypothetical protein
MVMTEISHPSGPKLDREPIERRGLAGMGAATV